MRTRRTVTDSPLKEFVAPPRTRARKAKKDNEQIVTVAEDSHEENKEAEEKKAAEKKPAPKKAAGRKKKAAAPKKPAKKAAAGVAPAEDVDASPAEESGHDSEHAGVQSPIAQAPAAAAPAPPSPAQPASPVPSPVVGPVTPAKQVVQKADAALAMSAPPALAGILKKPAVAAPAAEPETPAAAQPLVPAERPSVLKKLGNFFPFSFRSAMATPAPATGATKEPSPKKVTWAVPSPSLSSPDKPESPFVHSYVHEPDSMQDVTMHDASSLPPTPTPRSYPNTNAPSFETTFSNGPNNNNNNQASAVPTCVCGRIHECLDRFRQTHHCITKPPHPATVHVLTPDEVQALIEYRKMKAATSPKIVRKRTYSSKSASTFCLPEEIFDSDSSTLSTDEGPTPKKARLSSDKAKSPKSKSPKSPKAAKPKRKRHYQMPGGGYGLPDALFDSDSSTLSDSDTDNEEELKFDARGKEIHNKKPKLVEAPAAAQHASTVNNDHNKTSLPATATSKATGNTISARRSPLKHTLGNDISPPKAKASGTPGSGMKPKIAGSNTPSSKAADSPLTGKPTKVLKKKTPKAKTPTAKAGSLTSNKAATSQTFDANNNNNTEERSLFPGLTMETIAESTDPVQRAVSQARSKALQYKPKQPSRLAQISRLSTSTAASSGSPSPLFGIPSAVSTEMADDVAAVFRRQLNDVTPSKINAIDGTVVHAALTAAAADQSLAKTLSRSASSVSSLARVVVPSPMDPASPAWPSPQSDDLYARLQREHPDIWNFTVDSFVAQTPEERQTHYNEYVEGFDAFEREFYPERFA